MDIQVVNGKREGSYIYHCGDGFYYHFNNSNSYAHNEGNSSVFHLRCSKHYKRMCPGTAKIESTPNGIQWTNNGRHTCAPNPTYHQVLQLRQEILHEAVENFNRPYETPTQLVERIRARPHHAANVAAQVPPNRMRGAIYRAQNHLYPRVPISIYRLGEVLEEDEWRHLTSTLDGTDNIYAGTVHAPNGARSIIFMSRRARRHLRRAQLVFCDGTFGSRPVTPGSAQVLQIVAVVNNTVIPLVQVLMTTKTQEEYEAVLGHIRHLVPGFHPRTVMTDFEAGLQNAWRNTFHCQVVGCYWHYCRAVLKNAKDLGLQQLIRGDREVRSILRSFLGLPLLPQNLIARGFRTLVIEAARGGFFNQLNPFLQYWVDTWMSPHFLQTLSVYNQKHRTNNASESANKLLRSKTGAHRPGLWHFISALRRNEHSTHLKLRTIQMGLPANRNRRLSAINNDRRIRNYTRQLLGANISINRFLHLASTRVMRVFDNLLL